jgi:hypothetical protein
MVATKSLRSLVLAMSAAFLGAPTLSEAQLSPVRTPDIRVEPTYREKAQPTGGQYTEYRLKEAEERKKAVADVRRVTGPDSFVARALRVITGNGGSKNFLTITGQDGLTFGIKDFTSGGLLPLLQLIETNHHGAVEAAFGKDTPVLSRNWLKARTSPLNDHGLITIAEVRVGLDRILGDSRFYDEQLERFSAEAVMPSLRKFRDRKYKREFTLAAMIGAANSGGPGGLEKWLARAEANTGSAKEEIVIPEFMRLYVMKDAGSKVAASQDLLDKVFHNKPGKLPDWNSLGHAGRRLRWLAEYFSWDSGLPFTELGKFGSL